MSLLFGGHGALALEIALGAGLAQFHFGVGLQPRGGRGLLYCFKSRRRGA
ncbi:hypothetical protein [Nonomuraea sp. NPDC049684]